MLLSWWVSFIKNLHSELFLVFWCFLFLYDFHCQNLYAQKFHHNTNFSLFNVFLISVFVLILLIIIKFLFRKSIFRVSRFRFKIAFKVTWGNMFFAKYYVLKLCICIFWCFGYLSSTRVHTCLLHYNFFVENSLSYC